jgi:hypothetical protein
MSSTGVFLETSYSFRTHMQIHATEKWCVSLPYIQNTSFGCSGTHLTHVLTLVILPSQNRILDQHLYLGWCDQLPWPLHGQMQSGIRTYKCTFKRTVKCFYRWPCYMPRHYQYRHIFVVLFLCQKEHQRPICSHGRSCHMQPVNCAQFPPFWHSHELFSEFSIFEIWNKFQTHSPHI